jgi:Phage protein Gp138 N-terminal domain
VNREELYTNFIEAVQALVEVGTNHLFVAGPGICVANNGDGTAQVQLAILFQQRLQNGNWVNITPSPVIPKAVISYIGDKNFIFTLPCVQGTEGLLVFADRCIDGWWQNGGIQPQMEPRQHDVTDAFFFPGARSKPNAVQNINATSAELRTISGNTKITFDDTNGIVITGKSKIIGTLEVTQAITADAGVAVTGQLTATQNIIAGKGGGDQVGLQTHTHSGVTTGAGVSGAPTPGT